MNLIDTYEKFEESVFQHGSGRSEVSLKDEFQGAYHCSECQGIRKLDVVKLYASKFLSKDALNQMALNDLSKGINKSPQQQFLRAVGFLAPSLWYGTCRNCDSKFSFLIYKADGRNNLAVFSGKAGGIATPHTPKAVSFYLNQASKSHAVGANSAAMAMYRAALEQILFEQGYTMRMLGNKINALEKDLAEQNAKAWASVLDTETLKYLKQLGDGAIHPNDGDVLKQEALDNDLITRVVLFFNFILQVIYEVDAIAKEHKKAFQASSNALNSGKT